MGWSVFNSEAFTVELDHKNNKGKRLAFATKSLQLAVILNCIFNIFDDWNCSKVDILGKQMSFFFIVYYIFHIGDHFNFTNCIIICKVN